MEKVNSVLLGVHTQRFAKTLGTALESAGIESMAENLGTAGSYSDNNHSEERGASARSLVAVRVADSDLRRAVEIAEQSLATAPFKLDLKLAGMSEKLLIPVDFSDLSLLACRVGFELAARLGLQPVILHVYTTPYLVNTVPDNTFPSLDDNSNTLEEIETERDIQKIAYGEMKSFRRLLEKEIEKGEIKSLGYDVEMREGTPEEAILEYTRVTPPAMVVMATRGKDKKGEELVGSVTAEVLDSCRVPVFTVPENYKFGDLAEIKKLAFFCNLEGRDVKSMEFFMRMFNYPAVDIILVPASAKISDADTKIKELKEYLTESYPEVKFEIAPFPTKEFRTEFEDITQRFGLDMLMVPNKRSNIFARLFNPGIPHRVLFERDIPMLALPV